MEQEGQTDLPLTGTLALQSLELQPDDIAIWLAPNLQAKNGASLKKMKGCKD